MSTTTSKNTITRKSEVKKLQDFLLEKVINFIKFNRDNVQPMCKSGKVKEYLDTMQVSNMSMVTAYIVSNLMPNQGDLRTYVNRWMSEVDIEALPEATKEKLIRYLKCFCDIVSLL